MLIEKMDRRLSLLAVALFNLFPRWTFLPNRRTYGIVGGDSVTSEICIMNRLAVVLAADSATTVTYWGENGREERYFKGANKIFQLSNHHPVGVMIFDSADILKVPWELVIKSFREELGSKSFNELSGYADQFFAFIEASGRMFPADVQRAFILNAARTAALQVVMGATKKETDPGQQVTEIDAAMATHRAQIDAVNLLPCIAANAPQEVLADIRVDLIASLGAWLDGLGYARPTDLGALADLGAIEVIKTPEQHMGTTGLIFAGFGDDNVFPTMVEYISCGLIAGKHVHRIGSKMAIDHEMPAWLSAFAQTSMSDTFTAGVSLDVYTSVMRSVKEGLAAFADEMAKAAVVDIATIANLADLMEKACENISDAVMARARKEHAIPLRRVLGALPVDELAELAETLINLQSLKEKVTKPSESVGGPVDVAVITRSEGLVWVKRKHFFDAALNSRYTQRQMLAHQ